MYHSREWVRERKAFGSDENNFLLIPPHLYCENRAQSISLFFPKIVCKFQQNYFFFHLGMISMGLVQLTHFQFILLIFIHNPALLTAYLMSACDRHKEWNSEIECKRAVVTPQNANYDLSLSNSRDLCVFAFFFCFEKVLIFKKSSKKRKRDIYTYKK